VRTIYWEAVESPANLSGVLPLQERCLLDEARRREAVGVNTWEIGESAGENGGEETQAECVKVRFKCEGAILVYRSRWILRTHRTPGEGRYQGSKEGKQEGEASKG
jgi:hypothetical protein